MSRNLIKVLGMLIAVVYGIAGCGGGGSGGTGTQRPVTPGGNIAPLIVSGTASEGTLITGKTVKLKDANGTSAIDGKTDSTTGIYTIDVTGLIAPFLVTVTGTNGTYVSLAQAAGTANINPITTTVVALAAGNPDVSALFTSITPAQLTVLNTNYASKSVLVTTSLQSALPTGVQVQDYFTGTITAGTGLDSLFDTYQITVNPSTGITVKTKDVSTTTVLHIPAVTVTANTSQSLPTIIVDPTTGTFQSGLGSYTLTMPSTVKQNDVVPIIYSATNITNSTINFYPLRIVVKLNNTEIYRSSGDSNFVTIAPGETRTFTTSWNSKDNNGNYVAAGNYRLVGFFSSTSGNFGEGTDVPVPFVVQ